MGAMFGHHPAFEKAAIEIASTVAIDVQVLGNAFLQSCRGHDDLEHRTRGKLGLNGLVQQRMCGIGHQPAPLVPRYTDGKIVRVKRWTAHHRQDLARPRVHGHDGAVLPFQRLLGGNLDVQIHGQLQLLAHDRRVFAQLALFPSLAIDQHPPGAVLAHQDFVVVLLHARLAHDVAALIQIELVRFQHVFAYLAYVADQVGHEAVFGIEPPVDHDGLQLRKLIFMGFDEGALVGRDVVFDDDGLVGQPMSELVATHLVANFFDGHVQAFGDLFGVSD